MLYHLQVDTLNGMKQDYAQRNSSSKNTAIFSISVAPTIWKKWRENKGVGFCTSEDSFVAFIW